jgi:hypothetical protein
MRTRTRTRKRTRKRTHARTRARARMRACRYRAPELLLTCSEYGYEVDVWSGALRTDPQTP